MLLEGIYYLLPSCKIQITDINGHTFFHRVKLEEQAFRSTKIYAAFVE